jgi:esterase/lipase superfamily enzyme
MPSESIGGMAMRIFFLTNRNWGSGTKPSAEFLASRKAMASGAMFGFADAAPSANPDDVDNDWNVPPSKIKRLQIIRTISDNLESLTEAATGEDDVLIFIHGFANDFQNAVRRAARLAKRYYDNPPLVLLMSWPSFGNAVSFPVLQQAYTDDERSAGDSGPALALALTAALKALGRPVNAPPSAAQRKIRLVAHSMGNRALRFMLKALSGTGTTYQVPFDRVMMMAPDEDPDELSSTGDFAPLLTLCRALDVYFSLDDEALRLSEVAKSPFPPLRKRLGLFVTQERLVAIPTLTAVNCTDVCVTKPSAEWDHFKHQYYRARPEVIEDVRLMFRKGSSSMRTRDPLDNTGRGLVIRQVVA